MSVLFVSFFFFFSSRRRHTRLTCDWSSDVCSSDLGACVIVYPEGTASRDPDLWPMVGKTGVARLALVTGAPVIPVAHWGAQVILPYGSKKPHLVPRHLVRMLAGPAVDLSAYRGQPLGREVLRGATAAVMADITGLLVQLRGKEPP